MMCDPVAASRAMNAAVGTASDRSGPAAQNLPVARARAARAPAVAQHPAKSANRAFDAIHQGKTLTTRLASGTAAIVNPSHDQRRLSDRRRSTLRCSGMAVRASEARKKTIDAVVSWRMKGPRRVRILPEWRAWSARASTRSV